jgi:hypothetical protein
MTYQILFPRNSTTRSPCSCHDRYDVQLYGTWDNLTSMTQATHEYDPIPTRSYTEEKITHKGKRWTAKQQGVCPKCVPAKMDRANIIQEYKKGNKGVPYRPCHRRYADRTACFVVYSVEKIINECASGPKIVKMRKSRIHA